MVLLVRFGEIALKSRFVRRQLRDRLVTNIQDLFAAEREECVTESDEARIYVHAADEGKARGILARGFGIVSISPAREAHADLATLSDLAASEAGTLLGPGMSFAIRPRQVGTPFTSQDLGRDAGAAVRAAHPGVRVDLDRPDVEIHIEARRNRGFVFHEFTPGPGGLPLGSQGRALAFVESEPGMVAAWLGMKRGCRITVASPSEDGHVEPLRRWDVRLEVVEATGLDALRETDEFSRADAIFLGTRWGEFSPARRTGIPVPVFEPLIGFSDREISSLATRIRAA